MFHWTTCERREERRPCLRQDKLEACLSKNGAPREPSIRTLPYRGFVVATLTVGKEARMAKSAFLVALNTMNGFSVTATARLLFLWIGHGLLGAFYTRAGEINEKIAMAIPISGWFILGGDVINSFLP